jgi:hypothetical protein
MKIFKKILIALGVLFIFLVAFIIFISFQSSSFKKDYSPFVSKFMTEFSERWEINHVRDMLTNEFIDQINTPNGRQAINFFKQLGKLKRIKDLELKHFKTFSGPDSYKLGIFFFKADFENAGTLVKMIVVVKKGNAQVQQLRINTTGEIDKTKEKVAI